MAWLNTWKSKKLKKLLTNNSIPNNDMVILLFKCIHNEWIMYRNYTNLDTIYADWCNIVHV